VVLSPQPVSPLLSGHHAVRVVRHPLTIATALVLLCVTTLSPPAQNTAATPQWDLPALMTAMRQVRSSNARFVEMKYFHMLNQAQRSSGQLLYVAPNYLQKATTEPTPARLTISGDRLTIEQQGQPTRAISLQDYSEIGALVDSIRATLAGELPALTRSFTAALSGGADDWTMTLIPRDPKLREIVTTIRIQGERTAIRDVQTMQSDGDRTDMTVTPESK
jgi:hypothetical protein